MRNNPLKCFLTPSLLALLVCGSSGLSHARDWSPWQTPDDGALNGIEFSFADNCPPAGAVNCDHIWRFSSKYEGEVTVEYTIAWKTGNGVREKTARITLKPGENQDDSFKVVGTALDELSVKIVADKELLAEARKEVEAQRLQMDPPRRKGEETARKREEAPHKEAPPTLLPPPRKIEESQPANCRRVVPRHRRAVTATMARRRKVAVKRTYPAQPERVVAAERPEPILVGNLTTYLDSTILGHPVCP